MSSESERKATGYKDKTRINCFGQTLLLVCRLIIVYEYIIHAAHKKFLVIGEAAAKKKERGSN
jgi:hypothetical protein